ncbi:MAG: hypothetical protein L6Q57_04500 [Alphaproteobacteria bacterium]|nr:hypothetical protein [Alphaproteobacteria bacterium]
MGKLSDFIAYGNDEGFLLSLQYLAREAMNEGHNHLHSILSIALNLASANSNTLANIELNSNVEDAIRAFDFVAKFRNAPPVVQKKFLEILELTEE